MKIYKLEESKEEVTVLVDVEEAGTQQGANPGLSATKSFEFRGE